MPFRFVFAFVSSVSLLLAAEPGIHLEGAPNFRDFGGYRTTDGHTVKRNMLFRSGQLAELTPEDFATLAPLHIRYIFDLRTNEEHTTSPTQWPSATAPETISLSVGNPPNASPTASVRKLLAPGQTEEQVIAAMRDVTAGLAINGAEAIGKVVKELAMGDEPAIVHCTAGKDRTGVTSAVILTILGVPRDTVLADYEKTNAAMAVEAERAKSNRGMIARQSTLKDVPPSTMKILLRADPTYLNAAFDAIDAKYGSFDGYVRDGLHVTPAQIQALRAQLLEN